MMHVALEEDISLPPPPLFPNFTSAKRYRTVLDGGGGVGYGGAGGFFKESLEQMQEIHVEDGCLERPSTPLSTPTDAVMDYKPPCAKISDVKILKSTKLKNTLSDGTRSDLLTLARTLLHQISFLTTQRDLLERELDATRGDITSLRAIVASKDTALRTDRQKYDLARMEFERERQAKDGEIGFFGRELRRSAKKVQNLHRQIQACAAEKAAAVKEVAATKAVVEEREAQIQRQQIMLARSSSGTAAYEAVRRPPREDTHDRDSSFDSRTMAVGPTSKRNASRKKNPGCRTKKPLGLSSTPAHSVNTGTESSRSPTRRPSSPSMASRRAPSSPSSSSPSPCRSLDHAPSSRCHFPSDHLTAITTSSEPTVRDDAPTPTKRNTPSPIVPHILLTRSATTSSLSSILLHPTLTTSDSSCSLPRPMMTRSSCSSMDLRGIASPDVDVTSGRAVNIRRFEPVTAVGKMAMSAPGRLKAAMKRMASNI